MITKEEKKLWQSKEKAKAIKSFRSRTGFKAPETQRIFSMYLSENMTRKKLIKLENLLGEIIEDKHE